MPGIKNAPSWAADGGARPDPWVVSPDPLPYPAGDPPYRMWAADGRPPCGFYFLGCRRTRLGWFCPCPSCGHGWVLLVPEDDGAEPYRIAHELRCSGETCLPELIILAHLTQVNELPTSELDEQDRRYVYGALRRILGELPDKPDRKRLLRAAFDAGRWLATGGLPPDPVADALLAAADRAGFDPVTIAPVLADALTAGRARPGRLPR